MMRIFCAVVEIAMLPMLHAGQDLPLGRALVPPLLHEDCEDISVLVHGAPEILPLAMDAQEALIQVLLIARFWASTT
jgi:hypothetical protein